MGSERGQATVDYVAIIAVLAIVFTGALASAAVGAPGVVNAVAGQFRHALCLIGGGPCPDWRAKPCTVATKRGTRHFALAAFVFRYDNDTYVLREEMSDGTVRLTVSTTHSGGFEVGFGGGASVKAGGREVGASDEARAAAQLSFGSGTVYVADDKRQADAFMKLIKFGLEPVKPSEDFHEGGGRVRGQASLGTSAAGASLKGSAGTVIGFKRDLKSGDRTVALTFGRSGSGALGIGLGGATGSVDGSAVFNLTFDRHHHAKELSVNLSGTPAAGAAPPFAVTDGLRKAGAKGEVHPGAITGRRWELDARLDLRDPVVAAAWARFRGNPTSGDAIGALGAAIRDHASLDVRTYRTSSTSSGASGGVAEVVEFRGEYENTDDRSQLIAASSRPAGGLWEPRIDCEAA